MRYLTAAIKKKERQLTILANPKMVYYCRSSCLNLPVAIVDFKVEGCASRLHHVFQGEYVGMHDIDLDRVEYNISRDCVDELRMEGKPDKLNKGGHSTV